MGYPGGTRSVFTGAFRAKRELQCIFLGEKGGIREIKISLRRRQRERQKVIG